MAIVKAFAKPMPALRLAENIPIGAIINVYFDVPLAGAIPLSCAVLVLLSLVWLPRDIANILKDKQRVIADQYE